MSNEHECIKLKHRNTKYQSYHRIFKNDGEWYVVGHDNGNRSNTLRDVGYCPFCGEKLEEKT